MEWVSWMSEPIPAVEDGSGSGSGSGLWFQL